MQYINDVTALTFLKRVEKDIVSTEELKRIFIQHPEEVEYIPSLYVDFDKKIFYSMYSEPASYEDYAPKGWVSQYKDFLKLIPVEQCYWN